MTHQYATIDDTVYFWFGANDTSGSGGDGATPLFDVREAGATASAIPLLSGTPTLLTHANYPAGCHEVAVAATSGNGFAADDTFAVFCTLAIDSQNPTGFVGSCTLTPIPTVTDIWETVLTEAYSADGAAGTATQILYACQQFLLDADVSGTTMVIRKLDGTTAAITLTLDNATTPSDKNRTA